MGLAYGLAAVPGASQLGAAFIVLRWLGVTSWRAAEMAMLVSLPALALAGVRLFNDRGAALGAGATPGAGELALAVTVAFVAASLAAAWWKWLCETERVPWLVLWLVPLALALVAYGRALPHPTDRLPLSTGATQSQPRSKSATLVAIKVHSARSHRWHPVPQQPRHRLAHPFPSAASILGSGATTRALV